MSSSVFFTSIHDINAFLVELNKKHQLDIIEAEERGAKWALTECLDTASAKSMPWLDHHFRNVEALCRRFRSKVG